MEGGGGGWLASVAKGPSRTDAFRNPFVCPLEKGLQPDIRAQDDSRLAGCAHAFSAECTRGDDDEVLEEEGEGGGDIRTRIQEWNV